MNGLYLKIKQSPDCMVTDLQQVQPLLLVVLGWFVHFCDSHELHCEVTNIFGKFAVSKSDTHPEGRAFDASVRGWSKQDVDDCLQFMDDKAGRLGAFSASDQKQRVVVYHNVGLGNHLHFQIQRG